MQRILLQSCRTSSRFLFKHSTPVRCLSTEKPPSSDKEKKAAPIDVPMDFFDEKLESEKEFFDISDAVSHGSLESITTIKTTASWDGIDNVSIEDLNLKGRAEALEEVLPMYYKEKGSSSSSENDSYHKFRNNTFMDEFSIENEMDIGTELELAQKFDNINSVGREPLIYDEELQGEFEANSIMKITNDDMDEHIDSFEELDFMPQALLNYNHPWRTTLDHPDPVIQNLEPEGSPELYRADEAGLSHCPGKRQRRGLQGALQCHILDLQEVHELNTPLLSKFLSDDSEILPKKETGLCSKCQRQVAKCIKRSRHFGLLPHIGEFILQDGNSKYRDGVHHAHINNDKMPIESKTILSRK